MSDAHPGGRDTPGTGAGAGAVVVTVTLGELEQLRDRLGPFISHSHPDLSRWMVEAGAGSRGEGRGSGGESGGAGRPSGASGGDGHRPSGGPAGAGGDLGGSGGPVRWTATDSYRLGRLTAGTASGEGSFAIPFRIFTLAWQMAERRNAASVTFTVAADGDHGDHGDHGGREAGGGVLRVDGVEVPFDAGLDGYPDVEEYLARRGRTTGTNVTVAAEDLFAAIHGANLRPPWLDADQQASFVLHVDAAAGRLRAVAAWDGHADTSAAVACTADADTRVGVNPGFLYELASAAGEDILTLHLPSSAAEPVRVEDDDGFLALLMPVHIGVESARPSFEAMLAELLDVDPDDLERDGDGDYPVPVGDDHLLYLGLIEGDPAGGTPDTVHAFAILATGIDATPELLTELNDLNRNVRYARLYWAEGEVFVGTELLLASLDAAELGHACRTVATLAAKVAPLLEAVHGVAG